MRRHQLPLQTRFSSEPIRLLFFGINMGLGLPETNQRLRVYREEKSIIYALREHPKDTLLLPVAELGTRLGLHGSSIRFVGTLNEALSVSSIPPPSPELFLPPASLVLELLLL